MSSLIQIILGLLSLFFYQATLDSSSLWLSSLIGAFGLLLLGKNLLLSGTWNIKTAILLFVIAALVHYRIDVFFFWDEWHLIERFRTKGISEIFTSHNEHFLPLSFFALFTQFKLFSANYFPYLLVNFLAHTLNAYLLYKIFKRVFSFSNSAETLSRVFAFAYLVSALHGEALQWAFEQTLLFSSVFLFFSLDRGLEYLETGNKKTLFVSAAAAAVAPFCFGNGFIVILFMGALGLNYLFLKGDIKRLVTCLAVVSAALFLPLTLYLAFADFGQASAEQGSVELSYKLKYALKYLVFGSQLGTIARGLGLYPGLSFGSAREALSPGEAGPQFSSITDFSDAENIFLFLGLALSFVFFLYALCSKEHKKEKLLLFFLGQLWIILAFLLPAWSRYQLGHGQSLSLRYQYMALPGLFILIAPAAMAIISKWNKALISLVCSLFLFSQLIVAANFDYFTAKGKENRVFIQGVGSAESVPLTLTPGFSVEQVRSNC